MDGFENGFSSPKHCPKSSAHRKPSTFGETKENDIIPNEMGSNSESQNPEKPVAKHFMSPTISAASKVIGPRKKILAEKNVSLTSSDNTHFQKSPILESRNGLLHSSSGSSPIDETSSRAISACNCTSDCETDDDNDELKACFADTSLRPYDPLTNYLSPRPKYLLYRPNRRREIIQRSGVFNSQDPKFVDEEKSSGCDQKYLTPPPQEGYSQIMCVKGEDNENDHQDSHEEEEEEECEEFFEEDNSCSLKGLLTFLLLLIVIGLSNSHVSSMNSPRASPVLLALRGPRDGYLRIQNHVFEGVSTNVYGIAWGNRSGVQIGDGQTCFLAMKYRYGDHEFGRLQIDLEDNEEEMEESTDEMVEMPEPPNGQFEDIFDDDERDDDFNWPDWTFEDIFDDDERDDGFNWPDWEFDEIQDTDDEKKEIEEESDQLPEWESTRTDKTDQELKMLVKGSNCKGNKTPLVCESMGDTDETAFGYEPANLLYQGHDLKNDHKTDQFEGSFGETNGEEMVGIRPDGAQDTGRSTEDTTYQAVEETTEISVQKAGEDTLKTKLQISEATARNMEDEIFYNIELDTSRSKIEVKPMKVVKNVDFGPIFIATIWFFMFSFMLASLAHFYAARAIQAPLRDSHHEVSERKERLIQAQKGRTIEREESMNPKSHLEFQAQPVAQAQTLKVVDTDSPSYGSFTAEMIICRKEAKGGKDGDVKLITTPVRRSGRIRNRSITSP